MKKSLFIILGIFLIITAIISCIYYNYQKELIKANKLSKEIENFTKTDILGTSLMTLINKVDDINNKNGIDKNDKGLYKENNKNSIKIEIKFLESKKTFPMESILKSGSQQFVENYNNMYFKCIKKEYHNKTGQIKYMLFEQI